MTFLDPAPLVAAIDNAAPGLTFDQAPDGSLFRVGGGYWAERAGVCSRRQYQRWKSGRQRISWANADRCAIALGHHPAELWGDDWWTTDNESTAA